MGQIYLMVNSFTGDLQKLVLLSKRRRSWFISVSSTKNKTCFSALNIGSTSSNLHFLNDIRSVCVEY